MQKMSEAFRNISEVATELDVPKHVLRFWEAKFVQLKPMKRGGGRRYYRPEDVELLKGIRHLLYSDGYTIRGVQKLLRENGVDYVKSYSDGGPAEDAVQPAKTDKVAEAETGKVVSLKEKRAEAKPIADEMGLKGSESQREMLVMALSELEVCKKILHSQ
ncbi:MAG: MerR family transcriptional regulator [Methyloligellaceae bacterium]